MPLTPMLLNDIKCEADKWRYYAEDYAWRVIRLHDEEHVSPIDPDGKWYNGALVVDAVNRFRRQLAQERHIREEHESRDPDIQAQNEKYARGQAYRDGKLDEYDAVHHPLRLAERQRAATREAAQPPYSTPERSIGDILREMGITSTEAAK